MGGAVVNELCELFICKVVLSWLVYEVYSL